MYVVVIHVDRSIFELVFECVSLVYVHSHLEVYVLCINIVELFQCCIIPVTDKRHVQHLST